VEKCDKTRQVAYDNVIQCRNNGINIPGNLRQEYRNTLVA